MVHFYSSQIIERHKRDDHLLAALLGIGRSKAHPFALDLPPPLLLQILEDACGPHATADTHRHHTVASFAPLHLMHELDGELRARGSHGMTKCDGTAVHVHLLKAYPQFPDDH